MSTPIKPVSMHHGSVLVRGGLPGAFQPDSAGEESSAVPLCQAPDALRRGFWTIPCPFPPRMDRSTSTHTMCVERCKGAACTVEDLYASMGFLCSKET